MSTWKQTKPIKWQRDMHVNYAPAEMSWSYSTSADSLTIKIKTESYSGYNGPVEATDELTHHSQDEALVLLRTLIDWAETYEGEGTVLKMLNRRNQEREKT